MTSMFDFDDSVNMAFDAKFAGKSLVAAKHELLTKTGDFFFLAHSDRELAQRMRMVEEDIEKVAYHKLANVSDSKAKLVRAVYDEWQLRHASCQMCKTAVMGLAPGTISETVKEHASGFGGAAAGAAIGTMIAPGPGTAIGVGVGQLTGEMLNKSHNIKKHRDQSLDLMHHDYNTDNHSDAEHHPDHPATVQASRKLADDGSGNGSGGSMLPAGSNLPGNMLGGFCHGCASAIGAGVAGLAGLALFASKHAAGGHEVFCEDCKDNPSQIKCDTCKP